jgi:beta-lactamase regulating signal transducer with metallopeptidase domain
MNKYFDRMPLRTVRIVNRVIVLSGIAALLAAFILALPDTRRPASQMPWYFWLLVVYMALIPLYTPPARLGAATADMPTVAAWLHTVVAGLAAALITFAAVVSPPSAMMMVLLGLALSYALRGAQALLRKRRQRNHAVRL